jgi:hypothetical protein
MTIKLTKVDSYGERRLLIVHYGGDMLKAYRLLKEQGKQEYFSHSYNLKEAGKIGRAIGEAAFLCCNTEVEYDEMLEPGLRAIGTCLEPYQNFSDLIDLISQQRPTHLVIHFPISPIFSWATKNKIRTIGIFADSFTDKALKSRLRHSRLARVLNNHKIDFVANHGLNASRSLARIGVQVIQNHTLGFPYEVTPKNFEPKYRDKTDKIMTANYYMWVV